MAGLKEASMSASKRWIAIVVVSCFCVAAPLAAQSPKPGFAGSNPPLPGTYKSSAQHPRVFMSPADLHELVARINTPGTFPREVLPGLRPASKATSPRRSIGMLRMSAAISTSICVRSRSRNDADMPVRLAPRINSAPPCTCGRVPRLRAARRRSRHGWRSTPRW
jgi:hypothetical protein